MTSIIMIECGVGQPIPVDVAALPQVAIDHLVKIGLGNVLRDCHASLTHKSGATVTDKFNAATDKLAALMAGNVRTNTGGRTTDELAREVREIIVEMVQKRAVADGRKKSSVTPEEVKAALDAHGANEKIVAAAQKRLDAKRAASVDLEDLGL